MAEEMTDEQMQALRDRFQNLSFVCWCNDEWDVARPETLCSACREQVAITEQLKGKPTP